MTLLTSIIGSLVSEIGACRSGDTGECLGESDGSNHGWSCTCRGLTSRDEVHIALNGRNKVRVGVGDGVGEGVECLIAVVLVDVRDERSHSGRRSCSGFDDGLGENVLEDDTTVVHVDVHRRCGTDVGGVLEVHVGVVVVVGLGLGVGEVGVVLVGIVGLGRSSEGVEGLGRVVSHSHSVELAGVEVGDLAVRLGLRRHHLGQVGHRFLESPQVKVKRRFFVKVIFIVCKGFLASSWHGVGSKAQFLFFLIVEP
jgi:hypothetical protein